MSGGSGNVNRSGMHVGDRRGQGGQGAAAEFHRLPFSN